MFKIRKVPYIVKVRAVINAQEVALEKITLLPESGARTEIFWAIFALEFRLYLERWL